MTGWMLFGFGLLTYFFVRNKLPGKDRQTMLRSNVVDAAMTQVGQANVQQYWQSALPGSATFKGDWCGIFILWALHQAGLGPDVHWKIGSGFEEQHLKHTKDPQPGDVAYFDQPFQHRALVKALLPGGKIELINGNSTGGVVKVSTRPVSDASAYYSIQPLIDDEEIQA